MTPTKPYLLRAIYEWCCDNGFTPHLLVQVSARTRVPREHVQDGQIVLNISPRATPNLFMKNDFISFSARFGGVAQEIWVPMSAVIGLFARENGEGLFLGADEEEDTAQDSVVPLHAVQTPSLQLVPHADNQDDPPPSPPTPPHPPHLRVIK